MEPVVVDTAAGPIEVAEVGNGPAVLFVHGMPGDWSQAAPLARELAATNRVLLVSRPGYGRTPLRVGRTPQASAAAYRALLDALDIDRTAIVGISGGGPSSFEFAARERDRCAALILCCAVNLDSRVIPPALRYIAALPWLHEPLARLDHRRRSRRFQDPEAVVAAALEEANEVERARIADDPVALEWLREFVGHHLRVTATMGTFRHDLRNILRHQRRGDRLVWPDGPDVPTLLMHGDADPVVDLVCARDYAALIPGAELDVYPGGGHGFLFTFRAETTPRIRDFVAQTA